jgi:Coenzyme PQQ synthesis protein D (PqqD)
MTERQVDTACPRQVTSVIARHRNGGIIAGRGGPNQVALNRTALALWDLCDGRTTVAEMVDAVCLLFDIDRERALQDVGSALQTMRTAGVIE